MVEQWILERVDTQTILNIKHLHVCVPMFSDMVEEFPNVLLQKEIQIEYKH